MQYNGQEVIEANGSDYQVSSKPKRMLVWVDNMEPFEHDVLGFFNGAWLATDHINGGVDHYYHAAEIPKEPTLLERLQEIKRETGHYAYVVYKNHTLTAHEAEYAVSVNEEAFLYHAESIASPDKTFIVLRECSSLVLDMFRYIVNHKDVKKCAKVIFL